MSIPAHSDAPANQNQVDVAAGLRAAGDQSMQCNQYLEYRGWVS